jgi:magnesium dechelatase
MDHLNPAKLHIDFIKGTSPDGPITPRAYTLTHSDMTGDLFLTISQSYNFSQISGLYTRLMRDEVLAKWDVDEEVSLHVHCHVSGGLVFGGPKMRYGIFKFSLPLVLETFWYGDRILLSLHPELAMGKIVVHFHARQKKFNKAEAWGILDDYKKI